MVDFTDTFAQFGLGTPTPPVAHDPGPGQFVQGGAFGGLNFQPVDWGATFGPQPANPVPSLGSTFAPSQTSAGNVVTSQGASGSSAPNVGPTGAPINTIGTPSNAQAGAQPTPASGISSGSIADYFIRAVIVILGFIFVAIGLNMFKPGIVPVPGLNRR